MRRQSLRRTIGGFLLGLVAACGGGSGGGAPDPDPDPDPPPAQVSVSINDASATEGSAGNNTPLTFTVSISASQTNDVSVDFQSSPGSATASADYASSTGTLSIPAGETEVDLVFDILDDPDDESDESFTVTLSNASASTVITRATGTATIVDDDPAPMLTVSAPDVVESTADQAVFMFELSALARDEVSVEYASADATAVAPDDYQSVAGVVEIPRGERMATVTVPIVDDTIDEQDEQFELVLSNVSDTATLTIDRVALTIVDDDTTAAVSPYRLNDTGVTRCANGLSTNLDCNDSASGTNDFPGQDGETGRDAGADDDTDGVAGFEFTKLDAAGSPLPDQSQNYASTPWACIRDEVTGLFWETKTTTGSAGGSDETFDVFNPVDRGTELVEFFEGGQCFSVAECTASAYVSLVNANALCGFDDWRVPTRHELISIVHYGAAAPPMIDIAFFPNTLANSYWTDPAQTVTSPQFVDFFDGSIRSMDARVGAHLRLVRGGW
ncbi:MAG: Calx-beta domain-containing protein [Pseudomonadota bacterium]